MNRFLPLLAALIACNGEEPPVQEADTDTDTDTDADTDADTDTDTDADTDTDTDCDYPSGAVEPMADGETLTPYSWPDARSLADGVTEYPLDLASVHCANDPNIDWGAHEALMFVSVPAF